MLFDTMRDMNPDLPKNLEVKIDSNPSLAGLDEVLKDLERLFFAEASAKFWIAENKAQDLVLELRSPLLLREVLHHHRRGHWGTYPGNRPETGRSRLMELLQNLECRNGRPIDIEELSLELNDILIVVRKSGPYSIPVEFDRLLEALAAHFVYLTQGLQQMPYEIFIPALEDTRGYGSGAPAKGISHFYGYWAAYFDNEAEGRIYDLGARQLLSHATLQFGCPPEG